MKQLHGKKEIDLLIFDLDGTLIDSRQDLTNSVNHVRREFELPEYSIEQVMQFVGDGARKLIERGFPGAAPEELDEALTMFKTHYQQHIFDNTFAYPGVEDTLNYFSSKKKAVISNKPVVFTKQIVECLFPGQFDVVLGGDSLPKRKPSPEPILQVLQATNVTGARAAIIGDGSPDIESGKAAGVITCAVTYGFRSRDFLMQYEPDFCLDEINRLKEILV